MPSHTRATDFIDRLLETKKDKQVLICSCALAGQELLQHLLQFFCSRSAQCPHIIYTTSDDFKMAAPSPPHSDDSYVPFSSSILPASSAADALAALYQEDWEVSSSPHPCHACRYIFRASGKWRTTRSLQVKPANMILPPRLTPSITAMFQF